MEKLFEDFTRVDNSISSYNETSYNFWNRSGWSAADNVRNLLNDWFKDYPSDEKHDLLRRFKTDFDAAFFELFCYKFFSSIGFYLSAHPVLHNTTKRCDFKAVNDNLTFYIECISTSGQSSDDVATIRRIEAIFQSLNQMNIPNFFIEIKKIRLKSTIQPSMKNIKKELELAINAVDPDSIFLTEDYRYVNKPIFLIDNDKLFLKLSIFPKKKSARGKSSEPIGVYPFETRVGGTMTYVLNAFEKKANKYGSLPDPFLLAINSTSAWGTDDFDINRALYGNLPDIMVPSVLEGNYKIPNGVDSAFFFGGMPRYTRISSVFITNVNVANLSSAKYWIYHHPFAKNPLDISALNLNEHCATIDGVRNAKGQSIAEILNIPSNWPGPITDE